MNAQLTDEQQLALARFHVALAEVAPEISSSEASYDTDLRNSLALDTVSIWAIATSLERLSKKEIPDTLICNASRVSDLCEAIKVPLGDFTKESVTSPRDIPSTQRVNSVSLESTSKTEGKPSIECKSEVNDVLQSNVEEESQLASAEDLRTLFQ
ncbi:hypothetical protein [Arcanobacterium ihumii]|uniref:hypothetical protein n=1 Tax=Arcanobacterium ihumii TaxID=2138162 RepID=UPI000F522ADF|nr:hypothetical protein [Arcanobacterium ihumii]